jgi:hypothetical protein
VVSSQTCCVALPAYYGGLSFNAKGPYFVLVIVQFPLLDLRSFLSVPTGRLTKPTFPVLDPPTGRGRDWFVRGAGVVRRRHSHDGDPIVSENFYCDASGLLRLAGRALAGNPLRSKVQPYLAFRRLFWDGRWDEGRNGPARPAPVVGRIDLGFGVKALKSERVLDLGGAEVEQLLGAVLAQKVRGAWQPLAAPATDELAFVGPQLSATLLRATTSATHSAQAIANSWWMQAGRPSVIVELDRLYDRAKLPRRAKALSLPALERDLGARVHFQSFDHRGAQIPVWFIGHSSRYERRDVRAQLRRCLARMNAEVAALQMLGRMAADPNFQRHIDSRMPTTSVTS